MKKIGFLLFSILLTSLCANAQTFTQYVQQAQSGKGKVTVTQSKEIDDLVNGNVQAKATVSEQQAKTTHATATQGAVKTTTQQTATNSTEKKTTVAKPKAVGQDENHYIGQPKHSAQVRQQTADKDSAAKARAREQAKEEEERKAEERRKAEAQKTQESDEEMNIPTIDMRKKVMRGSRKVTGYRVQAYAGGNKRADKQKAQSIGDAIKMRYPDQPVYVHFYSPRWICRVGNYRTYGEASKMLKAIKAMGYKSATIVKGKITVFE